MLDIQYKGGNSVVLTTKKTTIYIDPNVEALGLSNPKITKGMQLATEKRFLLTGTDCLTFEGPGDYEASGVSVHGIAAQRHIDTPEDVKKSTVYRLATDEFSVGVVGNIDGSLTDEQYEELGLIDVLVVPVGGNGYTLDAKNAASLVRQVEPRAVVAVHYADNAIKYEVPQDELELFTQELNVAVEEMNSLKLKNLGALPPALTVYKLQRL